MSGKEIIESFSIPDLIKAYKDGNYEARNKLILKCTRNACVIATKYFGLGVEDEDLIQSAYEGLVIAIDELLIKNINSRAFYYIHINRRIEDAVRKAIGQSYSSLGDDYNESFGGMIVSYLNTQKELSLELDREPTREEIAERLNWQASSLKKVSNLLDRRVGYIDDLDLQDLNEVIDGISDVEFEFFYSFDRSYLLELIQKKLVEIPFTASERKLIDCFKSGIIDIGTLKSILGITHQQIYNLKKIIALKIRRSLGYTLDEWCSDDKKRDAFLEEKSFINKRKYERQNNRYRY